MAPHLELDLTSSAEPDRTASPRPLDTSRTAALVRAHAANDPKCLDPEAASEALRAPVASPDDGRGEVAHRRSARLLHRRVSLLRARLIGDAFLATVEAIAVLARRARQAYLSYRRAASTRTSLQELDDRMLHDLGIDRMEIASLGAEIGGSAERTRAHSVLALHDLYR